MKQPTTKPDVDRANTQDNVVPLRPAAQAMEAIHELLIAEKKPIRINYLVETIAAQLDRKPAWVEGVIDSMIEDRKICRVSDGACGFVGMATAELIRRGLISRDAGQIFLFNQ